MTNEQEKKIRQDYCQQCGFSDCLRGGCCGQNVLAEDVAHIHEHDASFNTMFLQVKYCGKIDESRYKDLKPDDRRNTKSYKTMLSLWKEVFGSQLTIKKK